MNFSMGLSSGEDDSVIDKRESQVAFIDEDSEPRQRGGDMDVIHHHALELNVEFWPVEHPLEPQDEDRPVKCPMPTPSVINDGRMSKERLAESLRNRTELPATVNKEGNVVVAAAETPVRAVRKRQHIHTQGDHVMAPLSRMPGPPALPSQNITMFQTLNQFDKFEY